MSFEQEQATIEALWNVAKAAGKHIQEWHTWDRGGDHKWFAGEHWNGEDRLSATFAEPGVIEYRLNHHADVRIIGINVKEVSPDNITIGPIEPNGPQETVSADVIDIRNPDFQDLEREMKFRDLASKTNADTVAKEVGASLSAGFRQNIGYGGDLYGISGETEFTLNLEASVKAAWDNAVTVHREREFETLTKYVARALHRTTVERIEQVGPSKQKITASGVLGFGIKVHSGGNWWSRWETVEDFYANLQGAVVNRGKDNVGENWTNFYRKHPVPVEKLAEFRKPVYSTVEEVREFNDVRNVTFNVRSEPLNDEARLTDALLLIADKGPNQRLRKLAKQALGKA